MRITADLLRRVWPYATFHGLDGPVSFGRVDAAHVPAFDREVPDGPVLYCCVYEDRRADEGWYSVRFDRTGAVRTPREGHVFLVDGRADATLPAGVLARAPHIRVPDVHDSIQVLREYVVATVRPRVVGVTGSVGKTTAVALARDMLDRAGPCARAYSKRLTPLTLASCLINGLDAEHRFLTLEYAMHRRHHVRELARLLRPDCGVLLNLRPDHKGMGGITSLEEIVRAKVPLLEAASTRFVNADEPRLSAHRGKSYYTFSLHDPGADAFVEDDARGAGRALLHLRGLDRPLRFRPYVRTRLFFYQAAAAALVARVAGVPPEAVVDALEAFVPAEERIRWVSMAGRPVLFDGEVTSIDRLRELSRHHYATSLLLVHTLEVGDADMDGQTAGMPDLLRGFDDVRFLDTEVNRPVAQRRGMRLTSLGEWHEGIEEYDFVVLHSGGYWRDHRDLGELEELGVAP
ncbi:MAG: Mur ligase family protein [Gemmatimonadota bacterium]